MRIKLKYSCSDNIEENPLSHATRVAKMRLAMGEGWTPEPIILGADGTVWDGLHRLLAHVIAGRTFILAIRLQAAVLENPDY